MRISHLSLGLLYIAAVSSEEAVDLPQITPAPMPFVPEATMNQGWYQMGEKREIVANPGAAQEPTQLNPTTTLWDPTTLADGSVVMVPTLFIQTFAAVPDQWPQPMSGAIGLGSLTSERTIPASPATAKPRSLHARSEGILGQTPWIGMVVGLACTTLAAVMLG